METSKKKLNGIIAYYKMFSGEKTLQEMAKDLVITPHELADIVGIAQKDSIMRSIALTADQEEDRFLNGWAERLPFRDKVETKRILSEAWRWGVDSMPSREPLMFRNRKI